MTKFTVCFLAAFACLFCFFTTPVAGQDKPAAPAPVSSPSLAPIPLPTPHTVLPTVSTATVFAASPAPQLSVSPGAAIIGTIVAALIGAISASVVSPFITYRLGERNRRLDLYKIYYPLKVKAVGDVSQALNDTYLFVSKYRFNMVSQDDCRNNVLAMQSLISSCSYFVEPETRECMMDCSNILFEGYFAKKLDTDAYRAALDKLKATYPQTLHLEVFADLFPPKKPTWFSTNSTNKKATKLENEEPTTEAT